MLTDADMHALGFIAKLRGRSAARMMQQNHTDNEREYRAMSKETSADTREIAAATAAAWLNCGAVTLIEQGEENSYYVDEFGSRYFAKDAQ